MRWSTDPSAWPGVADGHQYVTLWIMGRSQPSEMKVEWLNDDGPISAPVDVQEDGTGQPDRRRFRLLMIVAALVAFVLLANSLSRPSASGDGRDEALRRVEENRLASSPKLPEVKGEVNALDFDVVADLRSMADLDLAISAVVTTVDGTDSRLISVSSAGDILVAPLPDSTRFAFDSSGQWLAGISSTDHGDQQQLLWAGRVGGVFKTVTVEVQGYAWHESRPGLLAWSDQSGYEVSTMTLDQDGSLRVVETPVRGQLEGWGEWGFALRTTGPDVTTAVLDPDAVVMDQDLPGRYGGYLPGFGILLTGGAGDPLLFDPWSQGRNPVPWLESQDNVWTVTSSPNGVDALLLIGRINQTTGTVRGEVTIISADQGINVLAETRTMTDLAWTPDHTRVVYAEQQTQAPGSQGKIWAVGPEGLLAAVTVPDLFRGVEWVAALSVR